MAQHVATLILGAGVAGISTAYHLKELDYLILEAAAAAGGHSRSDTFAGQFWDEGPHISFTKNEYVKELFARNVKSNVTEQSSRIGNFYYGSWIDHPAQSNLYQAPKDDRDASVEAFKGNVPSSGAAPAVNYGEWLDRAFGKEFSSRFPRRYTRKYWTVEPERLSTSWISERMYRCPEKEFVGGAKGKQEKYKHYINQFRYPKSGGFDEFVKPLAQGLKVRTKSRVVEVNLRQKLVRTDSGHVFTFNRLISTIPLPDFIANCSEVPEKVSQAAQALLCTSVSLVDLVTKSGVVTKEEPYHWWYIYNEDFLGSRVSAMNRIRAETSSETPRAFQVEVYSSRERPLYLGDQELMERVKRETAQMCGCSPEDFQAARVRHIRYANVAYTLETRASLELIFAWLTEGGLVREHDDLEPMTKWNAPEMTPVGSLALAGRYGQWKYFWTDDCVLRGKNLADRM